MANAKPARLTDEPKDENKKPVIQYFGDGAEKVKFEVDPKATLIRVFANGTILVDY